MAEDAATLLLVEDEPLLALSEKAELENRGYAVVHASSGEEAVRAVESNPSIDLILMDVNLGEGMDGTEAAEIILRDRDLPLIFLSAHTERAIVEKTERITNYGYVVKGTGITVLDAAIKMAFKLFEAQKRFGTINEELQKYHAFMLSMIDSLVDVLMISIDREFRCQFINRRYRDLKRERLGIDIDVGSCILDTVDRDVFLQPSVDFYRKALAGETIRTEENFPEHGVFLDSVFCPMRSRSGEVIGATFFSLDVSRRKRLELDLGRIHREREIVLSYAPIGIANVLGGRLEWFNDHFAAVLGLDRERLIGKEMRELFPSREATGQTDSLEQLRLEDGSPRAFRRELARPDGSTITVNLAGRSIDSSDPTQGEIWVLQDITEQKRAEDELKAQTAHLDAFIDQAGDGIFILGEEGKILRVNPAFCRMHGYSEDEMRALGIAGIDVEGDAPAPERIRRIMAGEVLKFVVTHRHRDGHLIHFEVTASLVLFGGQRRIISIHRDITDRLRAQEEIRQLMEAKEVFLREVHHRVKNNMSSVIAILRYDADSERDPRVKEKLEDAAGRIRSMGVLYEKVYRSKDVRNVSLGEYLTDLAREIVTYFPPVPAIAVETDIAVSRINESLVSPLGMILYELVSNSMKYAFAGRERGVIRLSVRKRGDAIVFDYSDDGVGFPGGAPPEATTGFGMTLVGSLALQLGGKMTISGDAGARFVLEFEPG